MTVDSQVEQDELQEQGAEQPVSPAAESAGGEAPISQDASFTPSTILLVDDESNVLRSLKRLIRPLGHRVLTVESGAQGLEVMSAESVDLVISDMRMPEMDGATFLALCRRGWPDRVRIMLTGYSDIQSTVAAINQGAVYRYIGKPWEDHEVLLTIRQALDFRSMLAERRRLQELTVRQNAELREMNVELEETVLARTEELRRSFTTSIKVFSNLLDMRGGGISGHTRRVADRSRRIAVQMGLSTQETQEVVLAGLLHDIGKIGMPDELLGKSLTQMSAEERAVLMDHPVRAEAALLPLEALSSVGRIIRAHQECYDGSGYPDGLVSDQIPMAARILCVANEYDELQLGLRINQRLSTEDAAAFISHGAGRRFDATVVAAFLETLKAPVSTEQPREQALRIDALRAGMRLSRDIIGRDNVLLLASEQVLSSKLIERLRRNTAGSADELLVHVHVEH